jgi:proton translocating ATP synthase F1 alpha subunit
LSQHAIAYRQITLLLRIPPGREAYPGDIFYIQARLLERGAQLSKACGAGSLTILPIIETKGGDISAYIPTNVISITDGQVFLSGSIINKGLRPGVNIGLSVSRVGSKAQYNCVKYVSKKIKRDYMLYKTYEGLSKISSDMDPMLLSFVNRGIVIMKYLSQKLFVTVRLMHQVISFYCLSEGFFDALDTMYMPIFFELYFKGYFSEDYLESNEELFKFLIKRNFVFAESVFISSSIEPSLNEVSLLSRLFSNFFKEELLVKIEEDQLYYSILLNTIKGNLPIKDFNI